jgi:hypothetical protein
MDLALVLWVDMAAHMAIYQYTSKLSSHKAQRHAMDG